MTNISGIHKNQTTNNLKSGYLSGVPEKVNRFLTNIFSFIDEPNSLNICTE